MSVPAAAVIQGQGWVEIFDSQAGVQGLKLIEVLNNLAGICFGTRGYGRVPGTIDQLPHLCPIRWESSMPWASYKLEPLDPRVFRSFPIMGLKSGTTVVGVACYIETLHKVVVYSVENFLFCEEKYTPGAMDKMSVQNFMLRQEAEAIHKLLLTHYEKKSYLSEKERGLHVSSKIFTTSQIKS